MVKNVLEKFQKKHKVFVIAHRGANAECPENSMKSFVTAAEIGADMIEFDIHATLDGKIVVIHDSSAKRVSGVDINVEKVNYSELKDIDIGDGERIPLLADLFKELKGKVIFQIEIKQAGIVDKLLSLMDEYGVSDSCVISSFKHSELDKIKKLRSDIPCATLEPTGSAWISSWFSSKKLLKNMKAINADGTHPLLQVVNKQFVEQAHQSGKFVNPWTVDGESNWSKCLELGVDGIITNDPRNLIKYLEK